MLRTLAVHLVLYFIVIVSSLHKEQVLPWRVVDKKQFFQVLQRAEEAWNAEIQEISILIWIGDEIFGLMHTYGR